MRKLDHQNIVQLLYFFYSSGDKVGCPWFRICFKPVSRAAVHHDLSASNCIFIYLSITCYYFWDYIVLQTMIFYWFIYFKIYQYRKMKFIWIWWWSLFLRLFIELQGTIAKISKSYHFFTLRWVWLILILCILFIYFLSF